MYKVGDIVGWYERPNNEPTFIGEITLIGDEVTVRWTQVGTTIQHYSHYNMTDMVSTHYIRLHKSGIWKRIIQECR